jgi:hypothetical protein
MSKTKKKFANTNLCQAAAFSAEFSLDLSTLVSSFVLQSFSWLVQREMDGSGGGVSEDRRAILSVSSLWNAAPSDIISASDQVTGLGKQVS